MSEAAFAKADANSATFAYVMTCGGEGFADGERVVCGGCVVLNSA